MERTGLSIMTAPIHHPPEGLLTQYVAGTLDPATSLVIATHLAMCSDCARTARTLDAIGGALMEQAEPAPMHDGALEALMARIDAEDDALPIELTELPQQLKELAGVPEPVRALAARHGKHGRWRFQSPGIKRFDLDGTAGGEGSAYLLRIEPGSAAPRHSHGGQEFTLVLTGAFRDESGLYRAGDLAIGSPETTHRPVAEPGEVCISLAVTDAPLRLTGPLGFMQRILGPGE
jgi:putative transcriptional regulator